MIIDDARIDRIRSEMADALTALPDPGLEGAPTLRAQKAEARRIAQAQLDDINVTRASVAKFSTRIDRARQTRAVVLEKIADCERRAAASRTDVERDAWLAGVPYLKGESGFHEVPGAIVCFCRELQIETLPTLPTCDELLAQAESDLAPHFERLTSALDTWDRREMVTASIAADLPALQSSGVASVK